jgi:ribulose-phosphate 3-epimerase
MKMERSRGMIKTIGNVGKKVKIAAGLFWADYGNLGAQVAELESAGVDWIHLEMRDGKYMNFNAPRGGLDILEGIRPYTNLEIEVQIQMLRPTFDLYRQLKDAGADLITLPLETSMENTMQDITFIKDSLGLKTGVWGWQGMPLEFFKQYIPFVDIIEYESRAQFWQKKDGSTPHMIDAVMFENIRELKKMIISADRESEVELMEDGGLNADNSGQFIEAGMTVGEYSSPLLKGEGGELPGNKFRAGSGQITDAVNKLRESLDRS